MDQIAKARIAYTGPALDDGSMEVRNLAPALMAFAELVDAANKAIGGEKKIEVKLNQDSFRRGSFDITLLLETSVLEQVKLFTGMAEESGLADLMEVLGWGTTAKEILTGTAALFVPGIFGLIKLIKGRKFSKTQETEGGYVRITLSDGTEIETTTKTFSVYRSVDCRKHIEEIINPLDQKGVEGFELRNANEPSSKIPILKIEKTEKNYFKAPPASTTEEELPETQEDEITVRIVSLSFNKGQKWKLNDGNNTFWATIKDDDFWSNVEKRAVSFADGDMLRIRYYIKQSIKGGNLYSEYIVTKVVRMKKRPVQIELDFETPNK